MPTSAWSPVAKSFHWLVALLIFLAATLGWVSHEVSMSPGKLQLYIWHKSIGLTVLGIMILRLVWRLTQQAPADVDGLSESNHKLANIGHFAVYAFAILMPLSGWILNSAADFPFRWFGLFEVPMLIDPSAPVQSVASTVHLVFFWVLALLVAGHVGMAFKHHLAGIPILKRMLPNKMGILPMLIALWFGTVVLFGWAYSSSYQTTVSPAPLAETTTSVEPPVESKQIMTAGGKPKDAAKQWIMLDDQSSLNFIGTYDEIEFDGGFAKFSPTLHFDLDALSASYFDVSIDVTSVATDSADRDETIPNEDWFWFEKYKEAHYVAANFEQMPDGRFKASGVLELKGAKNPVPLIFSWTRNNKQQVQLVGQASIDRRDFKFGSGYWTDDPTVGFEITIIVDLLLEEKP